MGFTVKFRCSHTQARYGTLQTDHGVIETPVFMPVGTSGTVKSLNQHQLKDLVNAQIILGNTYHIYLRPGLEVMSKASGLHRFIAWDRPILTDSGGYQVYSLSARRKISEEGVTFSSHIDGSRHFFSPERAIEIQRIIGADIMMAFDECTPYPCEYRYAQNSMELTHRWLDRCWKYVEECKEKYGFTQILSPIVQGSIFRDLRKRSAEFVSQYDAPIMAIGGLSVGEPSEELYAIASWTASILPQKSARYLMGVGTPIDLLECISQGIDMFDCVLPTRNARHGLIYTSEGIVNIKNKKWAECLDPIDTESSVPLLREHSKAYLRHLIINKEMLGAQLASLQNLSFYSQLMNTARQKIKEDKFAQWKESMQSRVVNKL